MKNGTASSNEHVIDILITGEDTFSKTIAKLYTNCLSQRLTAQQGRKTRKYNGNAKDTRGKECQP